jgi:cell division protein FtsZ
MKEAFRVADGVLIQGVRGIADLILKPGIINGDFADVEAVLRNGGEALIGTGAGRGEEAVMDALRKALACPLLERAQSGAASNVMVSITADWEVMEASAIETAMNYLQDHYSGRPDIKACTVEGEGMEDRVLVTVLASGFDQEERLLEERRNSLHLGAEAPVQSYTTVPPIQSGPVPANVVSGRVYGEVPAGELQGPTPTRLLPQAPTPSGELPGAADDLHVPAIIRMGQGRLGIE